jgi:hypothetical protein
MHAHRTRIARTIPTTRSKVSNGTRLLQNVDLRSSSARRFRDLVRAYEGELGGNPSEAERSLVRQAVALQLQAERMQEQIVEGEPIDPDQLIRVSSTSKRLLGIIASRAGQRKPPAPWSPLRARLEAEAAAAAQTDNGRSTTLQDEDAAK